MVSASSFSRPLIVSAGEPAVGLGCAGSVGGASVGSAVGEDVGSVVGEVVGSAGSAVGLAAVGVGAGAQLETASMMQTNRTGRKAFRFILFGLLFLIV
jgi:hypothetical protein